MKNNKGRRNELTFLKYKKRIKRFVSNCRHYITQEGKDIYQPKAVDVINDKGQLVYKTTSVPCSCICCSSDKYKRYLIKVETLKLIAESSLTFFN